MVVREQIKRLGGLEHSQGGPVEPIDDAELARIESELGFGIPGQVRAFLSQFGSCSFRKRVAFPQPTPELRGVLPEIGYFFGSAGDHKEGFSVVAGFRNYTQQQRLPASLLPIAANSSCSMICVGITGEAFGKLFYWDADLEVELDDFEDDERETALWRNVYFLANSFEHLLGSLSVVDD